MKNRNITFTIILLVLGSFSLSPTTQAGQTPQPPPAAGDTSVGFQALFNNETGNHNSAYGWAALSASNGNLNIALGDGAGYELTTGDNNIDIGNIGVAGEANTIRIGTQVFTQDSGHALDHPAHTATYIAGVSGATVAGGVAVVIDANGHLGTLVSSAR